MPKRKKNRQPNYKNDWQIHAREQFMNKYGLVMSIGDCEEIVNSIRLEEGADLSKGAPEWVCHQSKEEGDLEIWLVPFGDDKLPIVYSPKAQKIVTVLKHEELERDENRWYSDIKESLKTEYGLTLDNVAVRTMGHAVQSGRASAQPEFDDLEKGLVCWRMPMRKEHVYMLYNKETERPAALVPAHKVTKERRLLLSSLQSQFHAAGMDVRVDDLHCMETDIRSRLKAEKKTFSVGRLSDWDCNYGGRSFSLTFGHSVDGIIGVSIPGVNKHRVAAYRTLSASLKKVYGLSVSDKDIDLMYKDIERGEKEEGYGSFVSYILVDKSKEIWWARHRGNEVGIVYNRKTKSFAGCIEKSRVVEIEEKSKTLAMTSLSRVLGRDIGIDTVRQLERFIRSGEGVAICEGKKPQRVFYEVDCLLTGDGDPTVVLFDHRSNGMIMASCPDDYVHPKRDKTRASENSRLSKPKANGRGYRPKSSSRSANSFKSRRP